MGHFRAFRGRISHERREIRTQTKVPQTCFVALRKLLSYSNLTLLPMLSSAAALNSLSRAFLMLMIWIKVHPGEWYPDAYNACESVDGTNVHTCPCVNDGNLVKAIQDPGVAPQPASHIFQLLNKSGLSSQMQNLCWKHCWVWNIPFQ